jgi:hypothetical protein
VPGAHLITFSSPNASGTYGGVSSGAESIVRKGHPVILLNLPASLRQRRLIFVMAVVLLGVFIGTVISFAVGVPQ